MKIGIFTDTYKPQINGVVTSILVLEKELRKKGHKVFIITTSNPEVNYIESNVVRLPSIVFKPLPQYRLGTIYSARALRRIKKLDLDIIHSQTEWGVGTFARVVSKRLHIPIVHTYHTLYEHYTHYITKGHFNTQAKKLAQKISKFYCEKCSSLIVPTDKVKKTLMSYGIKKKMFIVSTGINLEKFYSENFSKEDIMKKKLDLGFDKDDFICMYLGRVAKEKSIDFLIQSFNLIKDKNIKFLLVGNGPELQNLKNLVKDLNLTDKFIFTGEVEYCEVPLFYQVADVFLNASISETQGLTFIEAMAAKLPIIARFDENLAELINTNYNGFLYETSYEIRDFILKLKDDSQLRQNVVNNAFNISNNFSAQTFGDKIEEVYNTTLEENDGNENFTLFRGEKFIQQIRSWKSIESSDRSIRKK